MYQSSGNVYAWGKGILTANHSYQCPGCGVTRVVIIPCEGTPAQTEQ